MKFNLVEYRWSKTGVTLPPQQEKVIATFSTEKEAIAACDAAIDKNTYSDEHGGLSYFWEEDDSPLYGRFADELPSSDYWGM